MKTSMSLSIKLMPYGIYDARVSVTVCSIGVWKILAKFSNNPQQTFSAAFEVKEYGNLLARCQCLNQ